MFSFRFRNRTIMDYFGAIFISLGICFATGSASILGDECDWTGSGLTNPMDGSRGVTPIYLRCSAGRVTWLYPRGALRILLRLPGDREFRACVRARSEGGAGPAPARLFLEGPRSLLPLHALDHHQKGITRCFQSKKGQAAIYVEANGEDVRRRVLEVEYDLEIIPRGRGYDPTEECRPCTGEELAHAFCTSDVVTRGIIRAVENDEDRDISEMNIKITKLIRHATEDGYSNDIDTNQISDFDKQNDDINIQVARHCGVSHGGGEFVFMARRKLGDLTLRCAPRLEDWNTLVKTLTEEGKTHCVLRS